MNKLQERLFEINNRKTEIRTLIEENKVEDMESIEKELRDLNTEFETIEKRMKIVDTITITKPEDNKFMEDKDFTVESKEYRSAYLKNLMRQPLSDIEQRAYNAAGATGVIPTETGNMILTAMEKTAPMLNEITLMYIKGNLRISAQGTRNAAAQHTENESVDPAADTLATVDLAGYEYIKIISISETVGTMSVDSFENWLATMIAEDLAVAIENAIINGTGDGQPKGAKYAATWDATNSVDWGTGLLYTNITDAIGKLPAKYDKNAKFLMNKKMFWTQVANIKDSEGSPIVIRDFVSGAGTRILGYPLLISDKVADNEIYLGDFKKIVGNLSKDFTVESSRESGFRSASIDYRGLAIFDCDVSMSDAFIKLYS